MRNLKRALSLTLASVMLLGMMVIGTSAASFTDADQITNVTAATVLQELEVMQGNNGKFNPNQTVTRGQMAILICKMLYGSKLNAENFAGTSEFTDVPANAYYTGYVNLASQLGIISGYGNGKFGPGAPVTTAQAALMLTRALGWFQAGELENQNWTSNAIAAVEKATAVNLFGSMKLGNNEPLSRDNVCEMVFNAMTKTAPVNYNERWGTYYSDEGNIIGGVKFDYRNTLGYKNFTLVYNTTTDDFGHPSTQWGIGSGKLADTNIDDHGNIKGTVTVRTSFIKAADEADLTYTKDVKGKDIFADLGKPSDLGTLTIVKNGTNGNPSGGTFELSNSCDVKVGAKGSLTEVYKDNNNDVKIVVTDTYLVRATSDYNTKNEELAVVAYGAPTLSSNKIKNDDVTVSQFKKDDLILVTGVIDSNNKLEIKTAELAGKVENVKVSAYKANDYVTADKKYEYSAHKATGFGEGSAIGSTYSLQGTNYNLFLDKYGYVIAVDKYSDEVVLNDYLFVTKVALNGFNYQAKVVFMDGTEETITVAGTRACPADAANTLKNDHKGDAFDSVGSNSASVKSGAGTALTVDGDLEELRFYLYNKKSNGEYELEDLAGDNTAAYTTGRQGVGAASCTVGDKLLDGGKVQPVAKAWTANVPNTSGGYVAKSANDSTVFIAKDTAYTGVKNAPDVTAKAGTDKVYFLLDKDSNYILAVYTSLKGVATNSTSEYVYIREGNGTGKEGDTTYHIYTAFKDGEKISYNTATSGAGEGLYEINKTEDGYPVLDTLINASAANQWYVNYGAAGAVNASAITYKAGVVDDGAEGLKVNDETLVYVVDSADKSVNTMDASAVEGIDPGSYNVYAIYTSKSDDTVKTLWLVKMGGAKFGAGATATQIEKALAEGPVVIDGAISDKIEVKSGESLTLTGSGALNGGLKLNGGTVVVDKDGALPTLDSGSTGTITVNDGKSATMDTTVYGGAYARVTTSGDAAKTPAGQDVTKSDIVLNGKGHFDAFPTDSLESGVSMYTFKLPADCGGKAYTFQAYRGDTAAPVKGGSNTVDDSDETIVLLLSQDITKVVFTVTTPAGGGGGQDTTQAYTFNIK